MINPMFDLGNENLLDQQEDLDFEQFVKGINTIDQILPALNKPLKEQDQSLRSTSKEINGPQNQIDEIKLQDKDQITSQNIKNIKQAKAEQLLSQEIQIQQLSAISSISDIEQNQGLQNSDDSEELDFGDEDQIVQQNINPYQLISENPKQNHIQPYQNNQKQQKLTQKQDQQKRASNNIQQAQISQDQQEQVSPTAGYGSFLKQMQRLAKDVSFQDETYSIWGENAGEQIQTINNYFNQLRNSHQIQINPNIPHINLTCVNQTTKSKHREMYSQQTNISSCIDEQPKYIIDFSLQKEQKLQIYVQKNSQMQQQNIQQASKLNFIEIMKRIVNNYYNEQIDPFFNYKKNKNQLSKDLNPIQKQKLQITEKAVIQKTRQLFLLWSTYENLSKYENQSKHDNLSKHEDLSNQEGLSKHDDLSKHEDLSKYENQGKHDDLSKGNDNQ